MTCSLSRAFRIFIVSWASCLRCNHVLPALMPQVPRFLSALLSHQSHALSTFVTLLPCTLDTLVFLALNVPSGVSILTYSHASHVSKLLYLAPLVFLVFQPFEFFSSVDHGLLLRSTTSTEGRLLQWFF